MFVSSTQTEIRRLRERGLTIPEIARRLELAPTTVSYHVERLSARVRGTWIADRVAGEHAAEQSKTRTLVAQMLSEGKSRVEIARRLGLSKATISYHARRLNEVIDQRYARRYNWDAVQRYYDDGHSVRECIKAFGFSAASWSDAVNRGAIIARPAAIPISELLVEGTYRGRFNLKARLLKEGLKANRCERCGVGEWCGEPLTLALHHINGRRNDNRLENLELLCPNCHSQTDNYAGRNGRSSNGRPT
jgi:DNA-binding CsgD family transcriptional regulator/5-methylcytosine-specific restriction endonuclease McrA